MKADNKTNLLDTVPVPAEHIKAELVGEYMVLAYPRFKKRWMQRWLLPKSMSPYIHVTLEVHGTAVWKLIDGKRNVREIVSLLAQHFEGDGEYASRVTAYIIQLQRDGFVRLLENCRC